MAENDPQNALSPDFPSLPYRSGALSARKPTRFAFRPTAPERKAMAMALGLIDLPKFSFQGEIRPAGRHDFELTAAMEADAVQPCAISLRPVPCSLREDVRRLYQADYRIPETEEAEMTDDEAEPLPDIIDIVAVALEALALALPLYPRAEGEELGEAVFAAPGVAPLADAELKPFAGLAGLAERLKNQGSGSD